MPKKVSRPELFQLATGKHKGCAGYQFSTTKIAKFLGVSRQYIPRIIQEMAAGGYLACNNPKGNKKFWKWGRKMALFLNFS